jgi:hypothetical protein
LQINQNFGRVYHYINNKWTVFLNYMLGSVVY